MLWMVQRVFYGSESGMVTDLTVADVGFREQVAVWPMAVIMLVMGVASPYWIRAIDEAAVQLTAPAPAAGIGMAAKP
jgi:NADH-quinone oxidoreductase subunit M